MRWHVAVFIFAGCGGGSGGGSLVDATLSGRVCSSGATEADPTLIASPSLDCPSRMCLHVQATRPDLCTATCNDASDCEQAIESGCSAGMTCAPVIATGPFACQRICVCADRVPPPPACANP